MKRTIKYLFVFVLLILISISLYSIYIWNAAKSSLPIWQTTVNSKGLDDSVTIIRDKIGIPHIKANSFKDAIFAQGFVHAQDRLWQMALHRQRLSGRLAEWFGAGAILNDQLQRHARNQEFAKKHWLNFPTEYRPLINAYVNGINAYINSKDYQKPPEATLLHIDIEPWKPEDLFISYRGIYELLSMPGSEAIQHRVQLHADYAVASDGVKLFRPVNPLLL